MTFRVYITVLYKLDIATYLKKTETNTKMIYTHTHAQSNIICIVANNTLCEFVSKSGLMQMLIAHNKFRVNDDKESCENERYAEERGGLP